MSQAIIAFLESTDFEDAIRNSISLGGDADTQACITGALAEAHYKNIPDEIAEFVYSRLTPDINQCSSNCLNGLKLILVDLNSCRTLGLT